MDKITILLQDKHTIESLAKDETVTIKIKDAILDGVMHRLTPVTNAIAHAVINDVLVKNKWGGPTDELMPKWEKVIRFKVSEVVSEAVSKIITEEVKTYIQKEKSNILYRIENDFDIESIVENCVKKHLAKGVIVATN